MDWGEIANNWQGFRLSLYMRKPSKTRSWGDGVLSETQMRYLGSETQHICQQCWQQVDAVGFPWLSGLAGLKRFIISDNSRISEISLKAIREGI